MTNPPASADRIKELERVIQEDGVQIAELVTKLERAEAAIAILTAQPARCRDCDGYNCDNGCAYPDAKGSQEPTADEIERVREAVAKVQFGPNWNSGFLRAHELQEIDDIARAVIPAIRSLASPAPKGET